MPPNAFAFEMEHNETASTKSYGDKLRYTCKDSRYFVKLKGTGDATLKPYFDASCLWNSEDWDYKHDDLECVCKSRLRSQQLSIRIVTSFKL